MMAKDWPSRMTSMPIFAAAAQASLTVGPATTAGLHETTPNTLLTDAGAFGSFVLTKMRPRSRSMPS